MLFKVHVNYFLYQYNIPNKPPTSIPRGPRLNLYNVPLIAPPAIYSYILDLPLYTDIDVAISLKVYVFIIRFHHLQLLHTCMMCKINLVAIPI